MADVKEYIRGLMMRAAIEEADKRAMQNAERAIREMQPSLADLIAERDHNTRFWSRRHDD